MLALFCHIPANFLCLVRIRELDAVIKIMEDIRKLQGLRGIIQDFSRTLQHDSERQALLNAVKDRVLTRIKIVETFRRHVINVKEQKKADPDVLKVRLREATGELVKYFVFASETLGPASRWLELPNETQEERVQQITQASNALAERNFRADLSTPSSSFVDFRRPSTDPTSQAAAAAVAAAAAAEPARPLTPPMTPRKLPLLHGSSEASEDA